MDDSSNSDNDKQAQNLTKFYVQSCARQESNYSQDNIYDKNQFYVNLYNITDVQVKTYTKTKIPLFNSVPVFVNKEAIESYTGNQYGGRNGLLNIKALTMPLLTTTEGIQGAMLYNDKLINIIQTKIHWFQQPKFAYQDNKKLQVTTPQTVFIDYPLMLYKGFSPDNRELILANLADKEQP